MELTEAIEGLAEALRRHASVVCDNTLHIKVVLDAEERVRAAARTYDNALFAATEATGYSNPLYNFDAPDNEEDEEKEGPISPAWEMEIRLGWLIDDSEKLESIALQRIREHGDNRPQEIDERYAVATVVAEEVRHLLSDRSAEFGMTLVSDNFSVVPSTLESES